MARKSWLSCGGVLVFGLAMHSSFLVAGGKAGSTTDVAATLVSESTGDRLGRRSKLEQARDDDRNSEAWWQSGYVNSVDGWQSWDVTASANPEVTRQYRELRDQTSTTATDQQRLADWCREQGFSDQERAHLIAALRTGMVPHPQPLLKRLGYLPVGSTWLTKAEIEDAISKNRESSKEWQRLSPKLETLATRLKNSPSQREKVIQELNSLLNHKTVRALELCLLGRSEVAANALVIGLANWKSYHSSQSLTRIGICSPWESVRASAIEALKDRPREDFVPLALAALHVPLKMSVQVSKTEVGPVTSSQNRVEWRFLWSLEGRYVVEAAGLSIFDHILTAPERRLPIFYRTEMERQLLNRSEEVMVGDLFLQMQSKIDIINDAVDERNSLVTVLLKNALDVDLGNSPSTWWEWWDNEVLATTTDDMKPIVILSSDSRMIGLGRLQISCLAAGTPIWTDEGFRPIEEIRIGDRVLSKNIETGELKYQPVLHTTHRPGATVSELRAKDETIVASLGHNFWISGRGWARVNQMKNSVQAHTPTGTVSLEVNEEHHKADVYNLVVADFHTYFAGKSMLLGHDVITPAPTDIRVPGLNPDLNASK